MRIHACSLVLLLVACGGGGGGAPNVNIADEVAGANCPNGGSRIEVASEGTTTTVYGCDAASGGGVTAAAEPAGENCTEGGVRLDSSDGTFYVCNGTGGAAGGGTVTVTPESAGENCQSGGFRLDSGSSTSYVCHGTDGASVAVTLEAPGEYCAAGWFRLDSASGSSYVCHGVDGTNGTPGQSVAVTIEPPGIQCTAGGFRLESGSGVSYVCHGANGQSIAVTLVPSGSSECPTGGYQLDSASGSSFICNGADGAAGQSVAVTPEPSGTRCPAGGYRLDSASGTSYVCNGSDTITVTAEPAGANCLAGGYRLDTASDTYYVCNGVNGTGGEGGTGTASCEDADGDGRWTGCSSYTVGQPGPDCNDADATIWQNLSGFADQDLDGRTDGPLRSVCTGAALPVIYRTAQSSVEDCNDADGDIWQSCTTCRDADGDGRYAGCDAWNEHLGPDCNDADRLIGPHMTELPNDGRDNDCAGGDLLASNSNGIFVSKSGVDTNPGTMAAPKLTIYAAATAAAANGTRRVFVAEGTYNESVWTESSIFGGYQAGTWARNPTTYVTTVSSSGSPIRTVAGSTITVDGLSLTSTFTSGPAVEVDNSTALLTRLKMTVSLSGVEGVGRSSFIVNECEITGTGSGFGAIQVVSSSHLEVLGSRIVGNATTGYKTGISGGSENDALIIGNTIEIPGHPSYDVHGINFSDSRNVLRVERNTMVLGGATTWGVRVDDSDSLLIMLQNRIALTNRYTSYGVMVSTGNAIIAGNVFQDGASSIFYAIAANGASGGPGAHLEVLHNVVHADQAAQALALRLTGYTDVAAMNNVFWLETHGNAVEITSASDSIELYHNDLIVPAGRCLLQTSAAGGYCALDIDDVNWCAAEGVCAGVGSNISAAPSFVAPASNDYHLASTSTLIDRGFDPIAGDGLAGIDRAGGPLGSISVFAAGLAAFDVDGQLRPLASRWDIGLDER